MLFVLKLIVFFSIHSTENMHEVVFAHVHQGGIQIRNTWYFSSQQCPSFSAPIQGLSPYLWRYNLAPQVSHLLAILQSCTFDDHVFSFTIPTASFLALSICLCSSLQHITHRQSFGFACPRLQYVFHGAYTSWCGLCTSSQVHLPVAVWSYAALSLHTWSETAQAHWMHQKQQVWILLQVVHVADPALA